MPGNQTILSPVEKLSKFQRLPWLYSVSLKLGSIQSSRQKGAPRPIETFRGRREEEQINYTGQKSGLIIAVTFSQGMAGMFQTDDFTGVDQAIPDLLV